MDAHTISTDDSFDAASALLDLWKVKDAEDRPSGSGDEENKKTPKPAQEETTEDDKDADRPSEETEEGDEGDTEEKQETEGEEKPEDKTTKAKPVTVEDDHVVKVKIGEEDHEVKVGDLKRLFGQEKALTQKGMEVADRRKELDGQSAKYVAASEALLESAKARLKPYENIDWVQAAIKLAPAEYEALKANYSQLAGETKFLQEGLDGYMSQVQEARQNELINEAKATLKELSDPDKGIKGFSKEVYQEMRDFAISQGMPQEMMNQIVSAPALRLIHKALMFDKAEKAKATAAAKTTKVIKTATKIVKSASASEASRELTQGQKAKAMERLKATGHQDDAEAAFLERFSRSRD